jgi:hypothetical protein
MGTLLEPFQKVFFYDLGTFPEDYVFLSHLFNKLKELILEFSHIITF